MNRLPKKRGITQVEEDKSLNAHQTSHSEALKKFGFFGFFGFRHVAAHYLN